MSVQVLCPLPGTQLCGGAGSSLPSPVPLQASSRFPRSTWVTVAGSSRHASRRTLGGHAETLTEKDCTEKDDGP